MATLSNPRHERFAQELAKGTEAGEAYVIAGFRPNPGNARRLKLDEAIKKRVEAILSARAKLHERAAEKAAERQSVTVESLLTEAEEARRLAMKLRQPAAAVAAIKEKGVLAQVRVERSERKNTTDATRLSDEELDAAIAEALAREQAEEEGEGAPH